MRILDIREISQPISSQVRNAYIDFSAHRAKIRAPKELP
jgi:hypothetical protein